MLVGGNALAGRHARVWKIVSREKIWGLWKFLRPEMKNISLGTSGPVSFMKTFRTGKIQMTLEKHGFCITTDGGWSMLSRGDVSMGSGIPV